MLFLINAYLSAFNCPLLPYIMTTKKQQETHVNIVIIVATFYQDLKSARHVCSLVFQRSA